MNINLLLSRKIVLMSLLSILLSLSHVFANPIKRGIADRTALDFFAKHSSLRLGEVLHPVLVDTPKVSDKADSYPLYYIYSNGENGGFVFVSGDDRLPSILGYSMTGSYNPKDIPDEIRAFFDWYTASLREILKRDRAAINAFFSSSPNLFVKSEVAPLLKDIEWGQDYPWNEKTPLNYYNNHTFVGCVATCMSQIMKYYEWPDQSEGYHEYKENERWHKIHFGNRYNWSAMPNKIIGKQVSKEAVDALSTLCYDVGLCMDMTYGDVASGAYMQNAVEGVARHFKYSKGAVLRYRFNYSRAQWEYLLKNELSCGRPIPFGGISQSVGHAFVCDGYDKEGRFHINWGWSGKYNGFFFINALTPEGTGIGGGDQGSGYNYRQSAICGFAPDRAGTDEWSEPVISAWKFDLEAEKNESGIIERLKTAKLTPFLTSLALYKTTFKLVLQNRDNPMDLVSMEASPEVSLSPFVDASEMTLPIQDFSSLSLKPNTSYKVYTVFRGRKGRDIALDHVSSHSSEAMLKTNDRGEVVDIHVLDCSPKFNFTKTLFNLWGYGYSSITLNGENQKEDYMGNASYFFRESGKHKWYPLYTTQLNLEKGPITTKYETSFFPMPPKSHCDIMIKTDLDQGVIVGKNIEVNDLNRKQKGVVIRYDNQKDDEPDLILLDASNPSIKGFTVENVGPDPIDLTIDCSLQISEDGIDWSRGIDLCYISLKGLVGKKFIQIDADKKKEVLQREYKEYKEKTSKGKETFYELELRQNSSDDISKTIMYMYVPPIKLYDSTDPDCTVSTMKVGDPSLKVYPNPCTDQLHLSGLLPSSLVEMYSLDGVRVMTEKADDNGTAELYVSALKRGVYVIKVIDRVVKVRLE
ncbi:thiol protease/hemagglutinin PrtT [Falsiporphyromonas endometrii]|uniref:Thiol protease/hemagglutinin PrtT n=1 Tax=Falsiporphyromonas endometrii TaxID=1387297 RepID=A0ABV9K6T3_9PORP